MEEIRGLAIKAITEAINEWAFEDATGFVTYVDGVIQFLEKLENCPTHEFISITKKEVE